MRMDQEEFLRLLAEVMSYSEMVQNAPPKLIPQEGLVADTVIRYLRPYCTEVGGPLKLRKLTYVANRSNLIIAYPGETDKWVSFVGSHMDVVAADRSQWKRDPFKLIVEGDLLYGRGVTDCLGHVALLAHFFKQLAIKRPKLKVGVAAVLIANEESSAISGVGIDELARRGEIDFLKNGHCYWLDSANFGPTIGTGGALTWKLTATGKHFHSGFPHKAINAIELAVEALKYIEKRFYQDFPLKREEKELYKFQIGSSLKATQIHTPFGSPNAIPGQCTISGDVRITPLYHPNQVIEKIQQYVRELNVAELETIGYSSFELHEEGIKGSIQMEISPNALRGIACDLNSLGFHAVVDAIEAVRGECQTFSLTGSLPLICDLQDQGFDVQVIGFGRMEAYHAVDEFAHLSEFAQGFQVLARIVANVDSEM